MRKLSTFGRILAASALIALTPSLAAANDFYLIVPVEIRDAADAAYEARVHCMIYQPDGTMLREGFTDVALKNGAYSGRARVQIQPTGYPAGADPTLDGASARCSVSLIYECASETGPSMCNTGSNMQPAGGAAARRGWEAAPGSTPTTRADTRWDVGTVRVVAGSIAP